MVARRNKGIVDLDVCTNISIPVAPDNSDSESDEESESSYPESEGEDSELLEEVVTDDLFFNTYDIAAYDIA